MLIQRCIKVVQSCFDVVLTLCNVVLTLFQCRGSFYERCATLKTQCRILFHSQLRINVDPQR